MTTKWTGFPAAATFTSSDVLVGLTAGTANGRFLGNSFLLAAQNLSNVANAVTAFNNLSPLTTAGDMIYRNSTNNIRLALGTEGFILAAGASAPAWIANPGLLIASNLSDLNNVVTSRANLGVAIAVGAGVNSAIGINATAAGQYAYAFGNTSSAVGNYSWARGNNAVATNAGSVVWGDSNATPTPDSAVNQFNLSFANGYRFFNGDFNVATPGKGLAVAEGVNAKQGVVTLASGIGVVSNTAVTANSRIVYCGQDTDVTGFLRITARTTGSGFTITSSVLTDSGVVAYEIFEPAA